ncbi:MAG: hypothetical protein R3200_11120 [Xanthomonadales bacterium]|nr:hypothetical protein [Xanthomonadales bacterium]
MAQQLRFRVTTTQDKADALISELAGSPVIHQVQEISELGVYMHDDSSSADLPDDQVQGTHYIQLEFEDPELENRIRESLMLRAARADMALEILEKRSD